MEPGPPGLFLLTRVFTTRPIGRTFFLSTSLHAANTSFSQVHFHHIVKQQVPHDQKAPAKKPPANAILTPACIPCATLNPKLPSARLPATSGVSAKLLLQLSPVSEKATSSLLLPHGLHWRSGPCKDLLMMSVSNHLRRPLPEHSSPLQQHPVSSGCRRYVTPGQPMP